MILSSSRRVSAPMMWTSSWSRRSFSDKESRFTDVNGFHRIYRVTIIERYKVLLHCEPNIRSSDLLTQLGANQIWSI